MPDSHVFAALFAVTVTALVIVVAWWMKGSSSTTSALLETEDTEKLVPWVNPDASLSGNLIPAKEDEDAAFESTILKAQIRPVEQHFYSKLAGVPYLNSDDTSRVEILAKCSQGDALELRLEDDNGFDANAVAVLYAGRQVGFLRSEVAREMRQRETMYGVYLRKLNRHPDTQAIVGANIFVLVYGVMDLKPTRNRIGLLEWNEGQLAYIREVSAGSPYLDLLSEFVRPHALAFFESDPARDWNAYLNAEYQGLIYMMESAGLLTWVGKSDVLWKEGKWKLTSRGALMVAKNCRDEAVRIKARKLL